ncbi:unnamed protein product, partial [marine sediment metagenome]
CRICFTISHLLLHRVYPWRADWGIVEGDLSIGVDFEMQMDQTKLPDPSHFLLTDDGDPLVITGIAWNNAFTIRLTVDTYPAVTGPLNLAYPAHQGNFFSLAGDPVGIFHLDNIQED